MNKKILASPPALSVSLNQTEFVKGSQSIGAHFITKAEVPLVFPTLLKKDAIEKEAKTFIDEDLSWGTQYPLDGFDDAIDDKGPLGRLAMSFDVSKNKQGVLSIKNSDTSNLFLDFFPVLGQLILEGITVLDAILSSSPKKSILHILIYRTEGSFGKAISEHRDIGPKLHLPIYSDNVIGNLVFSSPSQPPIICPEGDMPTFNDNKRFEHAVCVKPLDPKHRGYRLFFNISGD